MPQNSAGRPAGYQAYSGDTNILAEKRKEEYLAEALRAALSSIPNFTAQPHVAPSAVAGVRPSVAGAVDAAFGINGSMLSELLPSSWQLPSKRQQAAAAPSTAPQGNAVKAAPTQGNAVEARTPQGNAIKAAPTLVAQPKTNVPAGFVPNRSGAAAFPPQISNLSKSPLQLNNAGLGTPQQAAAAYGAAEAPNNKWASALGSIGTALSKVLGQRGTDPRINIDVPLGLTFAEAEAVRQGQLAKFSAEADAAAKNADAEYRRAMAEYQKQALGMQERKFNEVELPLGQAQIVQAQQEAELARQTMGDRVAAARLSNDRSRAQLTTEQAQADRAAETVQAALDEADAKRQLIGAQAEDIPKNREDVRARMKQERAADEARIGLGYANLRESKNQNAFARGLAVNQLGLDQYKAFSDAAEDWDKFAMSLGGSSKSGSGGLTGPEYDQLNASFNSSLLDLAQKALLSTQKNGVKYEVPQQLGQLLGLPGKGLPTEGATKTPTPTELMTLVAGAVQASNDPALIAEMGAHEAAFASSVQNVAATTTKNADGSVTVTQGGKTVTYPASKSQQAADDMQKRLMTGYTELIKQMSK